MRTVLGVLVNLGEMMVVGLGVAILLAAASLII